MKVLGLSCGRRLGNSEILLEEALMSAAETDGIEVEIVRLHDLKIKPCTGCESCSMAMADRGVVGECTIQDDDIPWLMNRLLHVEAFIVSSPVYVEGPPGLLKSLCDRFLPWETALVKHVAPDSEIAKKDNRVGGAIAVGGGKFAWAGFGLPLLHRCFFPIQIRLVDQLLVTDVGRPGHVVIREQALEKARMLGRNVVGQMGKPADQIEFVGEDKGWCPVCHANVMMLAQDYPVQCPICGAGGHIETIDGQMRFVLDPRSLEECHLTLGGRDIHLREIGAIHKEFFENIDIIKPKLERYRSYNPFVSPPAQL